MDTYRRRPLALFSALFVVILAIAWVTLSPSAVGGPAVYVIITGNSMEPGFRSGDLVIALRQPFYQVTDLVVYDNQPMDRYVFHRIVGQDLDRFILKGDHNTWLDAYQPPAADILGAFWVRIPGLGAVMRWLRQPLPMAVLAGLLGLVVMLSISEDRSHRRSKKEKRSMKPNRWPALQKLNPVSEWAFFGLGVLLFASIIAAFFSFRAPLLRQAPDDVTYRQVGQFTYRADAPAGIYDTDEIRSGDPIFLELTCQIEVAYRYQVVGEQLEGLQGSQGLTAVVSDINGWKRTIPLQPETAFSGSVFTTTASLDLCQVAEMVTSLEDQTGLRRNEYRLTLQPVTSISGLVSGKQLQARFAPSLGFRFDEINFWLEAVEDPDADPLRPEQTDMLRDFRMEENTLSILGLQPTVAQARWISGVGVALGLAGLAALSWLLYRMEKAGPDAHIRLRYGGLLVDVARSKPPKTLVEVASIEDLMRLAERYGVSVLHEQEESRHVYLVHADQITYCYSVAIPVEEPEIEENSDV